jgi:hypothetical protein
LANFPRVSFGMLCMLKSIEVLAAHAGASPWSPLSGHIRARL